MADPKRIPHDGSACPVSPGTRVRVWWAHGVVGNAIASQVNWNAHPHYAVTHYAILEPDWAVEGPRLVEVLGDLIGMIRRYGGAQEALTDNACRECVGEAAISKTFACAFHRARTALSRIKGEEG